MRSRLRHLRDGEEGLASIVAMVMLMPLMFLFILYNFSAGLTLYWTVQNLLTIAQMKLTRTQEKNGSPGKSPAPVAVSPRKKK